PAEDLFQQATHQHVGIKTDAQGKQAPYISNNLDRKHYDRHGQDGAAKMFEVTQDAVMANALEIVIEKRGHTEPQRRLDVACGAHLNAEGADRHAEIWEQA